MKRATVISNELSSNLLYLIKRLRTRLDKKMSEVHREVESFSSALNAFVGLRSQFKKGK